MSSQSPCLDLTRLLKFYKVFVPAHPFSSARRAQPILPRLLSGLDLSVSCKNVQRFCLPECFFCPSRWGQAQKIDYDDGAPASSQHV